MPDADFNGRYVRLDLFNEIRGSMAAQHQELGRKVDKLDQEMEHHEESHRALLRMVFVAFLTAVFSLMTGIILLVITAVVR